MKICKMNEMKVITDDHATAKDAKEAGELIEQCWQYICTTPQGIMLFRKAKKPNE